MDVELISKKELLQFTSISYGQLYRWKRKNLIPEDWFIKKSVSTGQETFFPREKILERIERILELKDDVSLDELSAIFSPKVEEKSLSAEKLLEQHVISEHSLQLFENIEGAQPNLDDLVDVFKVKVLQDHVISGKITFPEGEKLLQFIATYFNRVNGENGIIILVRHMGASGVIGSDNKNTLFIDPSFIKVIEIEVMKEIGQIKLAQL